MMRRARRPGQAESRLRGIVDFRTLKLREESLSQKQRAHIHLIDQRFFSEGRELPEGGRGYSTPIELEEELFYLHALMAPDVLLGGARRRFQACVSSDYVREKFEEDLWVAQGNDRLAKGLGRYLDENRGRLERAKAIRLLDIGPCGGAITTLLAMRELSSRGLLEKTQIHLLDAVPDVLRSIKAGCFGIPSRMIEEFGLSFAGPGGGRYRELMMGRMVRPVLGRAEAMPDSIGRMDIVLCAYVHHHLNLHSRKDLVNEIERKTVQGGFIGVVDFFVDTFGEYMDWYAPHFRRHGTPPPIECPVVALPWLSGQFHSTLMMEADDGLDRSFMFWGIRQ